MMHTVSCRSPHAFDPQMTVKLAVVAHVLWVVEVDLVRERRS